MTDKTAHGAPYRRTLDKVAEDLLWPDHGSSIDPEQSRRHLAIAEVLRRIPDDDYQALSESVDRWQWFIPDTWMRGYVRRWHAGVYPKNRRGQALREAPYVDMVYLGPQIERAAWSIVVAIVAHELAHLVLRHEVFTTPDQYEAQEAAVFDRICEWGFRKEAVLHRAGWRRWNSRERTMRKKLIRGARGG
jgi:hypothetical protein